MLYEIDEARDEKPLELTCASCDNSRIGLVEIDDCLVTVGYCLKYGSFLNESELGDQASCWE